MKILKIPSTLRTILEFYNRRGSRNCSHLEAGQHTSSEKQLGKVVKTEMLNPAHPAVHLTNFSGVLIIKCTHFN